MKFVSFRINSFNTDAAFTNFCEIWEGFGAHFFVFIGMISFQKNCWQQNLENWLKDLRSYILKCTSE